MIVLYNLLIYIGVIFALPFCLVLLLISPRWRHGLMERVDPKAPRADVWVHAASVGEAEAAIPLISGLLDRGVSTRATTLTTSGRDHLRSRFPGLSVRLLPVDVPPFVQWSLRRSRPRCLLLIETELWPNLIHAAKARGVRVMIIGGRISDRSFGTYRMIGPVMGWVLRQVSVVAARSEADRERFIALGMPRERTRVTGDLKLDRLVSKPPNAELRAAIGEGPFLVGGSTHTGEEEALVAAWKRLRGSAAPELRLILVPRHTERAASLASALRRQGIRVGLRSEGAAGAEIVIVDSIGELGALYAAADLVFSGGSLAPIGGHNLVEAVQAGRVVVHGPHMANQRTQLEILAPLNVLHVAADARQLTEVMETLWRDPRRHEPAEHARSALLAHRGAVERTLEIVTEQGLSHA